MTDHNGKSCTGCGKRFCSNPTHLCERDFCTPISITKQIVVELQPNRSDEWGELRNKTARLGAQLVRLREELPQVEKRAKQSLPRDTKDLKWKITFEAKKRLPLLKEEIEKISSEHKELQADLDALTEFTSKLLGVMN